MKFRKPINKKKVVLYALALVLIFGGLGGAYYANQQNNSAESTSERSPTINYDPATDTEKDEAATNKDRIVSETQETASPGNPAAQKKAVIPTITQANAGGVNAYISGIFEEGGTCTATFTKGGTTLTKTSVGFQNVSYTQCAPISIEPGYLSSGDWSVTVSYVSATAQGNSSAQTIGVQ